MSVYLLHFTEPYRHARHYLGWSPEVQARVNAHVCGKGARLTEVVHSAGIGMVWVRTWQDGDRKLERKLKNRHSPQLCPICMGAPVQMPLLAWMPANVPVADGVMQDDDGQHDSTPAHDGPDLFDYEAELEEYIDDQLDREYHARGGW
jgi:hypothetical protein